MGAGDDGRLPGFMAMSALAAQSQPCVPPHHTPHGVSACDAALSRAASIRPVPQRPEQGVSLPQPTFGAAMPGGSPGYVPYGEAVTRAEFQQVSQRIGAVSSQIDSMHQAFNQLTQRDHAIMDATSKMVSDQVAQSNAQMLQMMQQMQLQMQQLTQPPRESKSRTSPQNESQNQVKHASGKSSPSEDARCASRVVR